MNKALESAGAPDMAFKRTSHGLHVSIAAGNKEDAAHYENGNGEIYLNIRHPHTLRYFSR